MYKRGFNGGLTTLLVSMGLLLAGCGSDKAAPEKANFGKRGDVATAARTVEIRMLPTMRFDPPELQAKSGETVTFKVVNTDKEVHEFLLGDDAYQADHERAMHSMDSKKMDMDALLAGVEVNGGETKSITWTFAKAGNVKYACHEPGHFAAGMVGSVTVG